VQQATGFRIGTRRLRRALLALALLALAFPAAYALIVPERASGFDALGTPPPGRYRVWVVDWGYHTSVALEQPPGWRMGPPGARSAPVLEWAWGDRAFFRDADYRPLGVAATLLAPTESVVFLRGHARPPHLWGADAVWSRTVGADELRTLVLSLERSIRHAEGGERLRPASVARFGGHFYPAHGAYLWTRNCNGWTVARLADAGLAESPAGVVFTTQVPGRLIGFSDVLRAPVRPEP
jgi:hypothetical protein